MNVSDIKSKISDTSTRYSSGSSISNDSDESDVKFPEIKIDINQMLSEMIKEFFLLETEQNTLEAKCSGYSPLDLKEKESALNALNIKIKNKRAEVESLSSSIRAHLVDISVGREVEGGRYSSLFENLFGSDGRANFSGIGSNLKIWVESVKEFLNEINLEYKDLKIQAETKRPEFASAKEHLENLQDSLGVLKVKIKECEIKEAKDDLEINSLRVKIKENKKPNWKFRSEDVAGVLNSFKELFKDLYRFLYWYVKGQFKLEELRATKKSLEENQYKEGRVVQEKIESLTEQKKAQTIILNTLSSDIEKLEQKLTNSRNIVQRLPGFLTRIDSYIEQLTTSSMVDANIEFDLDRFNYSDARAKIMINERIAVSDVLKELNKVLSELESLNPGFNPDRSTGLIKFSEAARKGYSYASARLEWTPFLIGEYENSINAIKNLREDRLNGEKELVLLIEQAEPLSNTLKEMRQNMSELNEVSNRFKSQELLVRITNNAELFMAMNPAQQLNFVNHAYEQYAEKIGLEFVNNEFHKHNFAVNFLKAMPEIQEVLEAAKYYELVMRCLKVNPEESNYTSSFYDSRDVSLWEREIRSIVKQQYKGAAVTKSIEAKLTEIYEKYTGDRKAEEILKIRLQLLGTHSVRLQIRAEEQVVIPTRPGYMLIQSVQNNIKSLGGWINTFQELKIRHPEKAALMDKIISELVMEVKQVLSNKSADMVEIRLNSVLAELPVVFVKVQTTTYTEKTQEQLKKTKNYEDMRKLIAA